MIWAACARDDTDESAGTTPGPSSPVVRTFRLFARDEHGIECSRARALRAMPPDLSDRDRKVRGNP